MRKKILHYITAVTLCVMLVGCNRDDVKDKVEKGEELHIYSFPFLFLNGFSN